MYKYFTLFILCSIFSHLYQCEPWAFVYGALDTIFKVHKELVDLNGLSVFFKWAFALKEMVL